MVDQVRRTVKKKLWAFVKFIGNDKQLAQATTLLIDLMKLKDLMHVEGESEAQKEEINEKCATNGVEYRINFYDVEITREDPAFFCDLIGQKIACFKDLDLALRVKKVVEKAFHDSYTYYQ